MFSKLIKAVVLFCSLSLSLAAHANTHTYDRIVVFGDSLSDNGNLFKWSGLPEKPYFDGRFSNGALWIEKVAQSLHLDTNSKSQFADYAFGGAWAADAENGVGGLVPLSFERTLYFNDTPPHSTDISNNLFVIWIGNNDYLQTGRLKEEADVVTNKTIQAIKTHIDALLNSGAKHFLILNLPNFGQTPKALQAITKGHPEYAANTTLLAFMHNMKLRKLMSDLSNIHPDVEFLSFNLAEHFDDLIQHPQKYNFKDVTHPCYPKGIGDYEIPSRASLSINKKFSINKTFVNLNAYPDLMTIYRGGNDQQQQYDYCANTTDYLFWDYVHPTTFAHELIAQFVVDLLASGKLSR